MIDKFFLSLLNYLMFAGTMFFAAAAPPVIASGGEDGGNDAGEGRNVDLPAETVPEGGSDSGEDAAETGEGIDAKVPGDGAKLDGRTMPPKVRETLDALKAADPQAHTWMKDRLFENREYRKELPGGLAELKQLKSDVATFKQEFPDVAAVKAEIAEWSGIDKAWNDADPKVIDVWLDANPQAFAKLMPVAIGKFAQSNPEGYQRYMSQVIQNTLVQSGVRQNLQFLNRLISAGDKEGASNLLKEVTDWMAAVEETSKKPVAEPEKPQTDNRQAELDERESKLWANETAGQVNPFRASLIRKEAQQYLPKGAELDDETFEALDRQIQVYMDKELVADPNFLKSFAAYADAKDTAGIVAFMKQKLQDLMPSRPARNGQAAKMGPVEKAVKLFFRGATPAKAKPAAGTGAAKPAGGAAPLKGWEKIGKPPAPHEIDHTQSPYEMKVNQQAILKSGKKVYWGNQIPT